MVNVKAAILVYVSFIVKFNSDVVLSFARGLVTLLD